MGDYAEYKALGICPECGKRPAAPGRVHCPACASQRREYSKRHRSMHNRAYADFARRRKENGLCRLCGQPSDNGVYCKSCAVIRNAKRWIIARRKREGRWTGKIWDEPTIQKIMHGIMDYWYRNPARKEVSP